MSGGECESRGGGEGGRRRQSGDRIDGETDGSHTGVDVGEYSLHCQLRYHTQHTIISTTHSRTRSHNRMTTPVMNPTRSTTTKTGARCLHPFFLLPDTST